MERIDEPGRLPKLVRNGVLDAIVKNEGRHASYTIITEDSEYDKALRRKVREEAAELDDATYRHNLIEEIADIFEVLEALMGLHGIESLTVLEAQMAKRNKLGGFERRIRLLP